MAAAYSRFNTAYMARVDAVFSGYLLLYARVFCYFRYLFRSQFTCAAGFPKQPSLSALGLAICMIFLVGTQPQMIWIDALVVVALMANVKLPRHKIFGSLYGAMYELPYTASGRSLRPSKLPAAIEQSYFSVHKFFKTSLSRWHWAMKMGTSGYAVIAVSAKSASQYLFSSTIYTGHFHTPSGGGLSILHNSAGG